MGDPVIQSKRSNKTSRSNKQSEQESLADQIDDLLAKSTFSQTTLETSLDSKTLSRSSFITSLKQMQERERLSRTPKISSIPIMKRNCVQGCHSSPKESQNFTLSLHSYQWKSATNLFGKSGEKEDRTPLPPSSIVIRPEQYSIFRKGISNLLDASRAKRVELRPTSDGFKFSIYLQDKEGLADNDFVIRNRRVESLFRLTPDEIAAQRPIHERKALDAGRAAQRASKTRIYISKSNFSKLGPGFKNILEKMGAYSISVTQTGNQRKITIYRSGPKLIDVGMDSLRKIRAKNCISLTLSSSDSSISITNISGVDVDISKWAPWLTLGSAKLYGDGSASVSASALGLSSSKDIHLGSGIVSSVHSYLSSFDNYREAKSLIARANAEDSYRKSHPEIFGENPPKSDNYSKMASELLAKSSSQSSANTSSIFNPSTIGGLLSTISLKAGNAGFKSSSNK